MKKKHSIALGLCIALAAGTAAAQVAPSLSARLLSVVNYYGDAQGHIPISMSTGAVSYVATSDGQNPFSIYTLGDQVAANATLAACSIDVTGALVGCDPAYGEGMIYGLTDLQSTQPDPTEFTSECHHLFGRTTICKFTWDNGAVLCYTCVDGTCSRSRC